MTPFNRTMLEVLGDARYDKLTGRSVDFRQIVNDAARALLRFIIEKLDIGFNELSGYNTDIFTYIFIAVGALLLAAASGALLRGYLRRRRMGAPRDMTVIPDDVYGEIMRNRYGLEELLALSREHAGASRMREAVRYRFIAVLVGLNERQAIRIEKYKTNAQLLQELAAAAPALTGAFTETVDMFHYAWFGYKPVRPERYAAFIEKTDSLIERTD